MHEKTDIAAWICVVRGLAIAPIVLLCSCQSLPKETTAPEASKAIAKQTPQQPQTPPPAVPQRNMVRPVVHHHHAPSQGACSCPHCGPGTLPAFAFTGLTPAPDDVPWKPDGIKGPWPKDEYVCDGGDLNHDVYVKPDGTVVGLDQQDTVGYFNTADGQTLVAASNCVCIYSPRFAAVRQVSMPIIYEAHERMAGVEKPTKLNIHEETRGPKAAIQPEQLIAQVGLDQVQRFRERTQGLLVEQPLRLELAAEALMPHEDLLFIQRGEFDASEKARLAQRVAAAETWTLNQAPQVLIEGLPAVEVRGTATPQVTYTYETFGKPCLRLCKIADKSEAKPGEIVSFTLRFDNVGDAKINSITIIDNLMPRLEYVVGTAQSTIKAKFSTQEVTGESVVLRWDLEEPLEVNAGGLVRFQARVR